MRDDEMDIGGLIMLWAVAAWFLVIAAGCAYQASPWGKQNLAAKELERVERCYLRGGAAHYDRDGYMTGYMTGCIVPGVRP